MSFNGVSGFGHVPAVHLESWPTPKFFSRSPCLKSATNRRILNESNRNATNSVNGIVDKKKDNGLLDQEEENSKVEEYLKPWQSQNKSNPMMQLLFDDRPEPETDKKLVRLTESEYRSMTAQLRDARQVAVHSKFINSIGLVPTKKNQDIYRAQHDNSVKTFQDKTWRPYLLQPSLLQQSFKGYINGLQTDSSRKTTDDRHQIIITSKARLNPLRDLDPKLAVMISRVPSAEIEVPRVLRKNQSSSGDEGYLPMNPSRPTQKDEDSTSSEEENSRYFLWEQRIKSNQQTKESEHGEGQCSIGCDKYRFASPLSEDVMRLDLTGLSRADRDWRTMTNVRPKSQIEARILDRLIQMERFQIQTVELENGMRRPIRNNLLQIAGKNARGRAPSRRGHPDFDNSRKSNAQSSADVVCQLCFEKHTVRSCVENVYASRSRSTIDFEKYERVTPHYAGSRMGPTVQGRSWNSLAPGSVRGRIKIVNGTRACALRTNDYYSGSTSASLRVNEYASTTGGSTRPASIDAQGDFLGAFNVLGIRAGQPKHEFSYLRPSTSFEASGSRPVAGATTGRGNLIVPAMNHRQSSIVDVEVRVSKPPRLKLAARTLKPSAKQRPQTAI